MIVDSARTHARWTTRTTFVLALSAAAVGFGNLWRFSYLSGEHGGGAFVISYLLCLLLIAVPILVAEIVLGNQGGPGPPAAIARAAQRSLRSRGWLLIGVLACCTGLLLLSLYAVVAGWGLAYADFMYRGVFASARLPEVGAHFERYLAVPQPQIYWQSLFLLVTAGVLVLGVRRGLGLLVWLLVPLMCALLAFLVKYAFDNGAIAAAGEFLFATRAADFTPRAVLLALAHALFTLGVGVGTGVSYGAYAPQQIPIGRSVLAVAVFDTMLGLLAGVAIFPVVFAVNLAPAAGPGLLFVSLPYSFGNLVEGELAGLVFFALLVTAALGSAVAIMEPLIATLTQQTRIGRFTATVVVGSAVWLLAFAVVTSLGQQRPFLWFGRRNMLGMLDDLSAAVLLPLVALGISVLVGWGVRPELLRLHLSRESALFFSLWRFLLRYIAPPAIAALMVMALLGAPSA